MDARLFVLLSVNSTNFDNLPFFITEAASGNKIAARFMQTTTADSAEVSQWPDCGANGWPPGCSMFHAVWLLVLGQPDTLKLVATNDALHEAQGLLRLDWNNPCADKANRLLETAPSNQNGVQGRRYSGVGKALVVRMALECLLQGNSTLFIRTHPSNAPFYTSLYFAQNPRFPDRLALDYQDAEKLLTEFFFGP